MRWPTRRETGSSTTNSVVRIAAVILVEVWSLVVKVSRAKFIFHAVYVLINVSETANCFMISKDGLLRRELVESTSLS